MCLCSGDPPGQRQSDSGHQPLQTAGEGGDSKRQQHIKHSETNRWVKLQNTCLSSHSALTGFKHFTCGLNPLFPGGGTALLDLSGLDTSPQSPPSFPEFPTPTDGFTASTQELGISLLDDELMSLGRSTSGLVCLTKQRMNQPGLRATTEDCLGLN